MPRSPLVALCVVLASVVVVPWWVSGCAGGDSATRPSRSGAALTPSDVSRLTGAPWKGTLTYLDYTSKVPTEIRSSLLVLPIPGRERAWDMRIGYADEPEANSGETAVLSEDGTVFRDQRVIERREEPDGTLRIVTEEAGEDDHKPAQFRFVYRIAAKEVSIQKLVKFADSPDFFERHIYRWTR